MSLPHKWSNYSAQCGKNGEVGWKRECYNIQIFSKHCIFPNQGKERSDLPATSIVSKNLLKVCVTTFQVDWYHYQASMMNMKENTAIFCYNTSKSGYDPNCWTRQKSLMSTEGLKESLILFQMVQARWFVIDVTYLCSLIKAIDNKIE